jgi:hypothetical protein
VLRKIFGLKRDDIGGWRKLCDEEPRNLYPSPSIIRMIKARRMRSIGHVVRIEKGNTCRLLVGKPEGKRALGRPRCRWADNIKMFLTQIGWGGMDWIDLAQDRDRWTALVNIVMNLCVQENVWKFLSSCTAGRFSRGIYPFGVSSV